VARIARRVGYQDVSRFGQHFKRQFNKTPVAWRNARHA
jgi:AraC-like DNA-binding protein